jgi:hypothetical protein
MQYDHNAWRKPSDLGGSGDGMRITDLQGHLLIVVPTGDEKVVKTSRGDADARPVKVLVVSEPGTGWREGVVFQRALRAQLARASSAGAPLVGRLGKGPAAPGKSEPWLILDPTDVELDQARAAYMRAEVRF